MRRLVSLGVTMRIGKIIFSVALLGLLTLASFHPHTRWLILNGVAASQLSKELLNQKVQTTPDWAIDMVIIASSKEHTVSFSEHGADFLYVYSPNSEPNSIKHTWQHLIGSWYVGKIKT